MYLYKGDKLFWNDSAALPNALSRFNRTEEKVKFDRNDFRKSN